MWSLVDEGLRSAVREHPGVADSLTTLEKDVLEQPLWHRCGPVHADQIHPKGTASAGADAAKILPVTGLGQRDLGFGRS